VGRAKKAAINIGERYATGTISVFRAAREGYALEWIPGFLMGS
jgi:hypothetical protein